LHLRADDGNLKGATPVATLEERVAYLEGRMVEHSRTVDGIREALAALEQRMDRRFERVDRRFEGVDRRFDALDQRIDALDRKLDHRTAALDDKMSRQFTWVVGIQVTTLMAIVAAFLSR
jgi:uncharacterized coiled-coil protein SlyX